MRVKAGKARPKYLGTLIFLLLFFFNEVFPNAAMAFTSLNACARSKECLELIKGSSSSAVSAPTGAGFGSSTLTTTTSSGAVRTLVKGVTDFAIVTGPTAAYVGWHYWNEAHNGRAQDRARELYCAAYPQDEVCTPFTGGQSSGIAYKVAWIARNPAYNRGGINDISSCYGPISGIRRISTANSYIVEILCRGRIGESIKTTQQWVIFYNAGGGVETAEAEILSITRLDGQPDTGGNPPLLPWKDWSQAKRDAAVALLNNSDWQRLITSMPFGGTLDPGDTVKAPKIPIPGQEWDNPNTPLDDRRLKTVPGEYARPVVPDFDHDSDPDETDQDDDNDGIVDPYDPEPRNPYVPRASSEPPPPPDDDRTEQSEGERAVSDVRDTHGDFLEKAENDVFENRLDIIEAKYKRAAAEEDEIERDWLTMEANDELAQLKNELGEAWWASLSEHEHELFNDREQAVIDEMQMHMKQWDKATYDDVVVSQKQGSGKVEKLKTPTRLSHVCSCPIQMATLSA